MTLNLTQPSAHIVRLVAWFVLATLVAVTVLGTTSSPVRASTSLHQTPPIAWNAPGFEDDCEGVSLQPGQVLWHFVLVQTTAPKEGSTLTATFASGVVTVNASKKTGGVLHFNVITGQTTLLGAITNRDGALLNLSHICVGPPTTTTTTTTTTTRTTTTTSSSTTTTTKTSTSTSTSSSAP